MIGVGLSGTNFHEGKFDQDEESWGVLPIGFTVHRRAVPAVGKPPRPAQFDSQRDTLAGGSSGSRLMRRGSPRAEPSASRSTLTRGSCTWPPTVEPGNTPSTACFPGRRLEREYTPSCTAAACGRGATLGESRGGRCGWRRRRGSTGGSGRVGIRWLQLGGQLRIGRSRCCWPAREGGQAVVVSALNRHIARPPARPPTPACRPPAHTRPPTRPHGHAHPHTHNPIPTHPRLSCEPSNYWS
jgi:hypothetical protein